MNLFRPFTRRFRSLFAKEKLDCDMAEEMRFHLEERTAENLADGLPSDEARYAAQRRFGNVASIQEQVREQRGWMWLEQIGKDLLLACQTLRRSPGFTAVAVTLLALGIGANSAFFSVFKAHALAPFPGPDSSRVVQLWRVHENRLEENPWSVPDFLDVHNQCASLAESGAFSNEAFNLGGNRPEVLHGVACTPGVLRALGLQPQLGRWFTDNDIGPGSPAAVILSHACWTEHFGADPDLIGRVVRLNAQNYVVVGVMPANFEFYSPHTGARAIDLWVPLRLNPTGWSRDDNWLMVVGRLKDGVTVEAANAELRLIANRLLG